jgi:hypothetical protein
MTLALEDRLKPLLPASIYDRHKIAREMRNGEPELDILPSSFRPAAP